MESPKKSDEKPKTERNIDKTVEDTFPASDPPSWSGGTATGDEEPE